MKKLSENILFEGQWLSVHELHYENHEGIALRWETVRRRKSNVGVIVIARLKHSRQFILIKQYRPAINGYILSFPAGLGTGDPQHALVELKEETGYTGTITNISPMLKAGASLIDDSAYIICADVDEQHPDNKNPLQHLEPAEDITVCLVSFEQAYQFLIDEQAKGTHVASNLWYLFGVPAVFLKS